MSGIGTSAPVATGRSGRRSRARAALAASALVVLAMGCKGTTAPATGGRSGAWVPQGGDLLSRTYYSGFTTPVQAIVADSQTWAATWVQTYGNLPPHPLPAIDFTAYRVIAVALGTEPSGGYAIQVDSAVTSGGTVVYLSTFAPGPTCLTTGAMTSPAELVRMPRPAGTITFRDTTIVSVCP